jgi:hypothetical protein
MKHPREAVLLPLLSMLLAGPSLAGEMRERISESATASGASRVPPVLCLPGLDPTSRPCLSQRLELDPRYQRARGRRNAGIALTTVGGLGGASLVIAGIWSFYAFLAELGSSGRSESFAAPGYLAIVGGGAMVVGLAVGIPLLVSGARGMRSARRVLESIPGPVVSIGPGRAMVGASWRF